MVDNGVVRFEVLQLDDSSYAVRMYTKPRSWLSVVTAELSREASSVEMVENHQDVFFSIEQYQEVVGALRTVCGRHQLRLQRIPHALYTYFRRQSPASDGVNVEWSKVPKTIRDSLFPYQREGIQQAIQRNGKLFFADEMGLGKSLQSIATLAYYATATSKHLVICPSYLRWNWHKELLKWSDLPPSGFVLVTKTKQPIDFAAHTIIISYDLAVRREAELKSVNWSTIICDESHYLKSRKAQRTKKLTPLLKRTQHVMLLSGTPAMSRPSELFPQLHVLAPSVFPAFTPFAVRYCDYKRTAFGWDATGASNSDELNLVLRSVMVRRLKKDVLTQLPSKTRETLDVVLKASELNAMQPLFAELEQLNRELRVVQDASEADRLKAFQRQTIVSELFRKTCHAKIPAVQEYIKELLSGSAQHILFAHHHAMLNALEQVCVEAGVAYVRIDGKTPHTQRQALVDRFRSTPQCRFAILGLHACSTGLNFTPIQYMVFCETTWCPSSLLQAEDRIHRIGAQGDSVHYTYICAQGTLDERVFTKLARKHALLDRILDSGSNADGFERTSARAFERDLEETVPATVEGAPCDLQAFGIFTQLRLSYVPSATTTDEFLHSYGVALDAAFVRTHIFADPIQTSPLHIHHSTTSTYVNLSEMHGDVHAVLNDNPVFLICDLALADVAVLQHADSDRVLDVLCGIDPNIPCPSTTVFLTLNPQRDSSTKRRRLST